MSGLARLAAVVRPASGLASLASVVRPPAAAVIAERGRDAAPRAKPGDDEVEGLVDAALAASPGLDEGDRAILAQRVRRLADSPGPRAGDYVRFADGEMMRIGEVLGWRGDPDTWIQVTDRLTNGYLGDGYVRMSGALERPFRRSTLQPTGERLPGPVWFFHRDSSGAGNGVHATVLLPVFACTLPAPSDARRAAHPPEPPGSALPRAQTPARVHPKPRAGRQSKLLAAKNIADFRPGIDRVERRGDRTFVVSGAEEYAPVEVRSDVMPADFAERLRAMSPDVRAKMLEATRTTPFLSPEGRAERLAAFAALEGDAAAEPAGVAPEVEAWMGEARHVISRLAQGYTQRFPVFATLARLYTRAGGTPVVSVHSDPVPSVTELDALRRRAAELARAYLKLKVQQSAVRAAGGQGRA